MSKFGLDETKQQSLSDRRDILSLLADRQCHHIVQRICHFAGYSTIVNMLCVSQGWNQILCSYDLWKHLIQQRFKSDSYKKFCSLNGWPTEYLDFPSATHAHLFPYFAATDLREAMTRLSTAGGGSVEKVSVFPGGIVNVTLMHDHYFVCGMLNGHIKVWDQTDTATLKQMASRLLTSHEESVTSLSARKKDNVLASGAKDRSIRLWSLERGTLLRILRIYGTPRAVALADQHLMTFCYGGPPAFFVVWTMSDGKVDSLDKEPRFTDVMHDSPSTFLLIPQAVLVGLRNSITGRLCKPSSMANEFDFENFSALHLSVYGTPSCMAMHGRILMHADHSSNIVLTDLLTLSNLWTWHRPLLPMVVRLELHSWGFCSVLVDGRLILGSTFDLFSGEYGSRDQIVAHTECARQQNKPVNRLGSADYTAIVNLGQAGLIHATQDLSALTFFSFKLCPRDESIEHESLL